jgi:hypothetical protein
VRRSELPLGEHCAWADGVSSATGRVLGFSRFLIFELDVVQYSLGIRCQEIMFSMKSSFEVTYCYVCFVGLRSYDEALDGHGAFTSPPRQLDNSKAARHFRWR